jgi:hypothetical protein
MSDETPKGAPAPTAEAESADAIKNVKAEFERKLKNSNAELLNQIQAMLKPSSPTPTPEPKKKVSVFENEEEYARSIKEEVKQEVRSEMGAQEAIRSRQQAALNELYKDFPELGMPDSELSIKAIEVFNAYDATEKTHPLAFKDAVKTAALELGVRPKAKRAKGGDDFSVGGSSSPKTTKAERSEIDQRTAWFAEAVGVDMNNKEVAERIKKNHGRKSYNNWG